MNKRTKTTEIIRNDYSLFYIDNLSTDIKELIKDHLSEICYGHASVHRNKKTYNYNKAIGIFLDLYNPKEENTKQGIIGELLTHIIITHHLSDKYITASRLFNAASVYRMKEGFDITHLSRTDEKLWINEIKSGSVNKQNSCNWKAGERLGAAKRDLKKRLNNKKSVALWYNALSHAKICLERKLKIKELLEMEIDNITRNIDNISSKDINVILTSVVFSNLDDKVCESYLMRVWESIEKEGLFNSLYIISIQKNTYDDIVSFLEKESKIASDNE